MSQLVVDTTRRVLHERTAGGPDWRDSLAARITLADAGLLHSSTSEGENRVTVKDTRGRVGLPHSADSPTGLNLADKIIKLCDQTKTMTSRRAGLRAEAGIIVCITSSGGMGAGTISGSHD